MTVSQLLKTHGPAVLTAFLLALITYGFSVCPTFPPGHDSAELITASASGGIAHPPGYPLYTIIGWLLTSSLPAEPALIMNVFAVFSAALACAFLAGAIAVLTQNNFIAIISVALYTWARTPWRMAVGAEVFSLHLAFCAALLFIAVLWQAAVNERVRLGAWAVFVLALALSHHHTVVLLIPGAVFFLWTLKITRQQFFRSTYLGWFVVGLLPYLWLPLRAAYLKVLQQQGQAVLNWGDPSSFTNFFWVVMRSGYGGTALSTSQGQTADTWGQLYYWAHSLVFDQYGLLAFLIGGIGIVYSLKKRLPAAWLFGGLFVLAGPFWAVLTAQPAEKGFFDMLERFYAASDLAFTAFVAWGLQWFYEKYWKGVSLSKKSQAAWGLSVVVLLALSLAHNYSAASLRNHWLTNDCRRAIVENLPPGSLVISRSDLTSGFFLYAQVVEKQNIQAIPWGVAQSQWFKESLDETQILAVERWGPVGLMRLARLQGRPVYSDTIIPEAGGFFVPCGLMYRYLAPGEPLPNRQAVSRANQTFWQNHFAKYESSLPNQSQVSSASPRASRVFWEDFLLDRLKAAQNDYKKGLSAVNSSNL